MNISKHNYSTQTFINKYIIDHIRLKCLRSFFTFFNFTLTLTLTFSACLTIHILSSELYILLGYELIPMMTIITHYTQLKFAGKSESLCGSPSLSEGSHMSVLLIMEFSVKSYVIGALK